MNLQTLLLEYSETIERNNKDCESGETTIRIFVNKNTIIPRYCINSCSLDFRPSNTEDASEEDPIEHLATLGGCDGKFCFAKNTTTTTNPKMTTTTNPKMTTATHPKTTTTANLKTTTINTNPKATATTNLKTTNTNTTTITNPKTTTTNSKTTTITTIAKMTTTSQSKATFFS